MLHAYSRLTVLYRLIFRYAGYANNVRDEARKQLRHAPAGVATVDIAACRAEKKAKADTLAAETRHNRIIGLSVGAVAVAALVFKAISVFRRQK